MTNNKLAPRGKDTLSENQKLVDASGFVDKALNANHSDKLNNGFTCHGSRDVLKENVL